MDEDENKEEITPDVKNNIWPFIMLSMVAAFGQPTYLYEDEDIDSKEDNNNE